MALQEKEIPNVFLYEELSPLLFDFNLLCII